MKTNQVTIYQLLMNKSFRQLSDTQKEEYQNRQTQLASMWQDETDELIKRNIYDELHYSLSGLVNFMAYKRAGESFSVEEEDFQGIIYLVLAETLIKFDRTLNKPFQPVFLYNVNNKIKMMYRSKEKDVHETTYFCDTRLDMPSLSADYDTMGDSLEVEHTFSIDVEHNLLVDQIINELFNGDEKKRTIVHMSIQEFKRNEIVAAIKEEGKSTDSVARLVNRTVKEFKATYLKLK